MRDGGGSVRGDTHGLAPFQFLAVEVGDGRPLAVGAMVETNRVASAMPYEGLIAVGGNPYGAKAVLKVSMALDAHRLRTEDQHDIAQVDVVPRRRQATLRGVLAGEVGCGGDDAAVPRPGRQRVDPALGRRMNAVGDISVEWPP